MPNNLELAIETLERLRLNRTNTDIGTGIYTLAEAARLLKVGQRRLTRWAEGYVYLRNGSIRSSGPIIDRRGSTPGLLTFSDLIELAFVREFSNLRVQLPTIRKAAEILREEWQTPYPFASNRLAVSGQALFDKAGMLDVVTKQKVFEFARNFFKDVDVDDNGQARAWYPLGHEKLVVIDPQRSYGAPIDFKSGVRTEILYRQHLAGESVELIANWYGVTEQAVQEAIEFEEWVKAA